MYPTYFLVDWMPGCLECQHAPNFWPDVVSDSDRLPEARHHVQEGNAFTYAKKVGDMSTNGIEKVMDHAIAEHDSFVVGICDPSVDLDEG